MRRFQQTTLSTTTPLRLTTSSSSSSSAPSAVTSAPKIHASLTNNIWDVLDASKRNRDDNGYAMDNTLFYEDQPNKNPDDAAEDDNMPRVDRRQIYFESKVQYLVDSYHVFYRDYFHIGYGRTYIQQLGRGAFTIAFRSDRDMSHENLDHNLVALPFYTLSELDKVYPEMPLHIRALLNNYPPYEYAIVLFAYWINEATTLFTVRLCPRSTVSIEPPTRQRSFLTGIVNSRRVCNIATISNVLALQAEITFKQLRLNSLYTDQPSLMDQAAAAAAAASASTASSFPSTAIRPAGSHFRGFQSLMEYDDPTGILRVCMSVCYTCSTLMQLHSDKGYRCCKKCRYILYCSAECQTRSQHRVEKCLGPVATAMIQSLECEKWLTKTLGRPIRFPDADEMLLRHERQAEKKRLRDKLNPTKMTTVMFEQLVEEVAESLPSTALSPATAIANMRPTSLKDEEDMATSTTDKQIDDLMHHMRGLSTSVRASAGGPIDLHAERSSIQPSIKSIVSASASVSADAARYRKQKHQRATTARTGRPPLHSKPRTIGTASTTATTSTTTTTTTNIPSNTIPLTNTASTVHPTRSPARNPSSSASSSATTESTDRRRGRPRKQVSEAQQKSRRAEQQRQRRQKRRLDSVYEDDNDENSSHANQSRAADEDSVSMSSSSSSSPSTTSSPALTPEAIYAAARIASHNNQNAIFPRH